MASGLGEHVTVTRPEYLTIQRNVSDIVTSLAAQVNPGLFAQKLSQVGLVSEYVVQKASSREVLAANRIQDVIQAVLAQIKLDPSQYHNFISALRVDHLLLAKKLTQFYESLRYSEPKCSNKLLAKRHDQVVEDIPPPKRQHIDTTGRTKGSAVDLDKPLSLRDREMVYERIKTVKSSWKPLGRKLLGQKLEYELESIDHEEENDDERLHRLLGFWLTKPETLKPTWRSLAVALREIGREDLAGDIEHNEGFDGGRHKSREMVPADILVEEPKLRDLRVIMYKQGEKLKIIDTVQEKWEDIADFLDLTGLIADIKSSQSGKTDAGACKELLWRWLNGDGREPRNWYTVIDVLKCVGYRDLAEDIPRALRFRDL